MERTQIIQSEEERSQNTAFQGLNKTLFYTGEQWIFRDIKQLSSFSQINRCSLSTYYMPGTRLVTRNITMRGKRHGFWLSCNLQYYGLT